MKEVVFERGTWLPRLNEVENEVNKVDNEFDNKVENEVNEVQNKVENEVQNKVNSFKRG